MSALDKKIAELKGLTFGGYVGDSERGTVMWIGSPMRQEAAEPWSTSDSKALELVDEISEPLFFIERYGASGKKMWKAHFAFAQQITYFDKERNATVVFPDAPKDISGEGSTRPEAICRAYIAVMEWKATQAARF